MLTMIAPLLVSALLLHEAAASPVLRNDCPDGAFQVGAHCYFFSPQTVNWFEAEEVF